MNEETFDIDGAAKFLCVHPKTISRLAADGEIPDSAKIGRAWVFLKSGLIEYIRRQAAMQNMQRKAEKARGNPKEDSSHNMRNRRRGRDLPSLPDLPPC
jgi:predicted DNA-binding transcriptional regulator AlpA